MKNGLHKLFLAELHDIYDAERQLVKALPKLAKAAKDDKLRQAIESHLDETKTQVARLEEVFRSIEASPKRTKCKAMAGLIDESNEIIAKHKNGEEIDAAIICAAQKTEHYEVATYGCLCTWAEQMSHETALVLLRQTLAEEKEADITLTEIAQATANLEAESVS